MNNDGNPFAGDEPNAAAGQEDPGGDFNLARCLLHQAKRTCELVARCCGTRKRNLQSQQTTSNWTERHGRTDRGETCLFGTS